MWLSHSVTLCYKAIKRAMSTVKNYSRDIIRISSRNEIFQATSEEKLDLKMYSIF